MDPTMCMSAASDAHARKAIRHHGFRGRVESAGIFIPGFMPCMLRMPGMPGLAIPGMDAFAVSCAIGMATIGIGIVSAAMRFGRTRTYTSIPAGVLVP